MTLAPPALDAVQWALLGGAGTLTTGALAAATRVALLSLRDSATPLARAKALRRERPPTAFLPYQGHVDDGVVSTRAGDYVQAFRLSGISFESADDDAINQWHERLNLLMRNVANEHVALWTHLIRRRTTTYPESDPAHGFALRLETRYRARLAEETLMVNDLYVAVVYRPWVEVPARSLVQWLTRRTTDTPVLTEALEACAKLRAHLESALDRYDPEPLGLYTLNGRLHSSLLEYLALLVNADRERVPVPPGPLTDTLLTTRPLFGAEAMEYRQPTTTRLSAFLGIKEYPATTQPGCFNALLQAPYPLVFTQSFTTLPKAVAQTLMTRQSNRLTNANDIAISQTEALHAALDGLASNDFVLGDHHASLQVLTDPVPATEVAAHTLTQLLDRLAHARATLADAGLVVAREDLALEAAYWAQLPGNFAYRPRKSSITSRNWAAMSAFHNFPTGRAHGNHWGDALTVLMTRARSPYYFSLHASDPRDADGGSRKDIGHTSLIGPTGSGKTVVIGFLLCLLRKKQATQIVFDKDRGLEILIRAEGGRYLPLQNGNPTGMNPLQLPATPDHLAFLTQWLHRLVEPTGTPLTTQQQRELDAALHGTLALPKAARRLSRLREFLDPTDPEGLHARLRRWCADTHGDLAWVFDHPDDQLVDLLDHHALVGIDVTDFLDHPLTRGPVTLYLFHLVKQWLDGRRVVVWMDEFAKLLADPAFEQFAKDGLKTWRKLDAVAAFATQSPTDVLQSPIARTLIEQTPTKIFFPNADANESDYRDGFGLTEQEFLLIKQQLEPGHRQFLLKQGHHSVVCELDLKGFDAELAVISGRTRNREHMQTLIDKHGDDPADWLKHFMANFDPESIEPQSSRQSRQTSTQPISPGARP